MKKHFALPLLGLALPLLLGAQPNRDCRSTPSFMQRSGLDLRRMAFSTSDRKTMGLLAIELDEKGGTKKTYRHPSWGNAGWAGPFVLTETGEIWLAPVPLVNTLHNPPEQQNRLWKVDAQSGELRPALDLPRLGTGNAHQNPYGLLGLGYDCDTRVLYASSVAGSTMQQEIGRLFALRSTDQQVVATLDSLDAFGVGVGTIVGEKRLYFGKARSGRVYSIGLRPDGGFVGSPRLELSLDDLGPRGDDRARKIRFSPDGTMTVTGIEFYYNLTAPTEKQETIYQFRYQEARRQWVLVGMQ
jgi:hypothetical protein